MSASPVAPTPSLVRWTTSPIIDYEPAPVAQGGPCLTSPLHRPSPRPMRSHRVCEPVPPKSAVVFAETALRQVIEVIDRRRPVAQLRPLLAPALVDRVLARVAAARTGSATLLRVRVRAVDSGPTGGSGQDLETTCAAEVFATFRRSGRVHAIAARIERYRDRWRIVALQIG